MYREGSLAADANHHGSSDTRSITITPGFAFNGFDQPIEATPTA
jgi:hypothetical protein